jgi:hypothetical protein
VEARRLDVRRRCVGEVVPELGLPRVELALGGQTSCLRVGGSVVDDHGSIAGGLFTAEGAPAVADCP